jgi:hypothetical protein
LAWNWTGGLCGERLQLTSWAHCSHRPQIITELNKSSQHYSIESLLDTSKTTAVGSVPCSSSCADSTTTTWKWPIRYRGNILSTNTATGWSFNYILPQSTGPVLLHILQCTNGLYSFFHTYILYSFRHYLLAYHWLLSLNSLTGKCDFMYLIFCTLINLCLDFNSYSAMVL